MQLVAYKNKKIKCMIKKKSIVPLIDNYFFIIVSVQFIV